MADDMRALRSAIGGAEVIIAGVPAGLWHAPTPCQGVDVWALVNHLVTGNLYFASLIRGLPLPDGEEDVATHGLAIARRQLHNRPEGAFGAEVKVPEDAAAIDRLAGFLGRRA